MRNADAKAAYLSGYTIPNPQKAYDDLKKSGTASAESSALTVGGSGNLLLLELNRDYATDTDTDEAGFISLRIKYGRTV